MKPAVTQPHIELQRCPDSDSLDEVIAVLDHENIPYRISSVSGVTSEAWMGATGSQAGGPVAISVAPDQWEAARSAMEKEYLKYDLPEDHFLHRASDEEIASMLGEETSWSPFDVAHARRLAATRGIDSAAIAARAADYRAQLEEGICAPSYLIWSGWALALLGGLGGLLIGWKLAFSKKIIPGSEFFTYDAPSRKTGHLIFSSSCLSTALTTLYQVYVRVLD